MTLVLVSADKANKLAAEVTDSLMNFLLVSFFMVPHVVNLSTDYADSTDYAFEHGEAFANNKKKICVTNDKFLLFWQDHGPGRTKFNSRGRAALREAHGKIRENIAP